MTDPLSISVSILTILETTKSVIEYLHDSSDASEDRSRLFAELMNCLGPLYFLEDRALKANGHAHDSQNANISCLKSLAVPNGPLDQYKATLERLVSKLKPVHGFKKLTTSVAWPFQKRETMEIFACIERQKSNFLLALQNDHMYNRPCRSPDFTVHSPNRSARTLGNLRRTSKSAFSTKREIKYSHGYPHSIMLQNKVTFTAGVRKGLVFGFSKLLSSRSGYMDLMKFYGVMGFVTTH
jgi:hypothetical protein